MKKRDLLIAGLFLCSVSAFAQPQRYDDDAKVIFVQDFEGEEEWQQIELNEDPNRPTTLFTWQAEPVDEIDEVAYYKKQFSKDKDTIAVLGSNEGQISSTNIYTSGSDYQIAGIRDTFIFIYNGVVRTDAVQPDDSLLASDSHAIKAHDRGTLNGEGAGPGGISGKEFGLTSRYAEDGGKKYFQYVSASGKGENGKQVANWSNGRVPEYRRNLFVRLDPGTIEPYSSYRVTVYVKAVQLGGIEPQFALDLMRGYFHSEKGFIVNFDKSGDSNEFAGLRSYSDFNKMVEYEDGSMEAETGKWQKLTLMAYYMNDSLGRATPYLRGYYWPGDWIWQTTANKADSTVSENGDTTMVFRYIQQPDKYFVRMSFRSDSTRFMVDNLSLTKSWIGGVEHYNDMIRVDFGYKTNLGALAEAAKKINKIATVEVPGDNFEVWARWGKEWEEIPILTAEYQGDGYMYMWTKPYEEDGAPRTFEGADEVLVTFFNPEDPALELKYSSNDLYPNAQDTNWVKAGKRVFDFHNEISLLNPTIVVSPKTKKAVKSLQNLPPVLQYEAYEDGTFGLDPNLRTMTVKFSRTVAFDNAGAATNLTQVSLSKGNVVEYWNIKSSDENGYTVIERPAKYTSQLQGDYVLSFKQVTHNYKADANNDGDFGDNVSYNYHFGEFSPNPAIEVKAQSDWRDHLADFGFGGSNTTRPLPDNIYMHSGADSFRAGEGVAASTKLGLYPLKDDTITVAGTKVPDNCLFYLSNRSAGAKGNLYAIENLKAGKYAISFKFGGRSSVNWPLSFYFYAKPTGTLENGNDKGFATLEAAEKTQLIRNRKPAADSDMGEGGFDATWKQSAELITCNFEVPTDGDYVFEWVCTGSSNHEGIAIGNYWITNAGDLSFGPVQKYNEAKERISTAWNTYSAEMYKGTAYNDLSTKMMQANVFLAETSAANNGHAPSAYDSVISVIDAAIKTLNERVDTVKIFNTTLEEITKTLADEATYNSTDAYTNLKSLKDDMAALSLKTKTNAELAAYVLEMQIANGNLLAIPAITTRLNALSALSVQLGSDITTQAGIKEQLESLITDNNELGELLKAATALAIYQKAKANIDDPLLDSLDVTPFIKNYNLYASITGIANKTKLELPNDRENSSVKGANNPGYAIMKVGHQWGKDYYDKKCWVLMFDKEFTDVFPGWSVQSYITSSHSMVSPDNEYTNLSKGIMAFDGSLSMDWNSKAELKQNIEDLPVGQYTLGVSLPSVQAYKAASSNWWSSSPEQKAPAILSAIATDSTYTCEFVQNKKDVTLTVDSVIVKDGSLGIGLLLQSLDGGSEADNFTLAYRPIKDFNYGALIADQQQKISELITVIKPVDAKAANVEFFTLDGKKAPAAKSGQIMIRKTTQANGTVVVDKVLIK